MHCVFLELLNGFFLARFMISEFWTCHTDTFSKYDLQPVYGLFLTLFILRRYRVFHFEVSISAARLDLGSKSQQILTLARARSIWDFQPLGAKPKARAMPVDFSDTLDVKPVRYGLECAMLSPQGYPQFLSIPFPSKKIHSPIELSPLRNALRSGRQAATSEVTTQFHRKRDEFSPNG
jgi:hypothetical protein